MTWDCCIIFLFILNGLANVDKETGTYNFQFSKKLNYDKKYFIKMGYLLVTFTVILSHIKSIKTILKFCWLIDEIDY